MMINRLKNSSLYHKFFHWEYWPFPVFYFPVFFYWLWLSLKSRSFFFFSASNPSIKSGGMLGESKFSILEKIAPEFKPATILVEAPATRAVLESRLKTAGITFPLIAKPDIGERGWLVEKITNWAALEDYFTQVQGNFIIQAFVDFPVELGVFYYRFPSQKQGHISSIVVKDFLKVKGDGHSTILELIEKYPRARFQRVALQEKHPHLMGEILADGKELELVPIGNHCKGTTFLNGNQWINAQLVRVFDEISRPIQGFYFGRFDLRCTSIEDLYAGQNIRIVELNGAGAEPGHIYQPGFSIIEAYRVIFSHWRIMYQISQLNNAAGNPYMTLREGRAIFADYQNFKQVNSVRRETVAPTPLHTQLT
ncbi:MAG: hypothetical protein V4714_12470 [Bacteroidota bacterium]